MSSARLRDGDLLAGAGGVALLVLLFLPWYEEAGRSLSAWSAFTVVDVVLAVVAVAAIAVAVLNATQRSTALTMAIHAVTWPVATVVSLVVVYRLINQPGSNEAVDVRYGAWLGLIAVVTAGLGVFRALADERPRAERWATPRPAEPLAEWPVSSPRS